MSDWSSDVCSSDLLLVDACHVVGSWCARRPPVSRCGVGQLGGVGPFDESDPVEAWHIAIVPVGGDAAVTDFGVAVRAHDGGREFVSTEERRLGTDGVWQCRLRWVPDPKITT